MTDVMKKNRLLFTLLILTYYFFFRKGMQYAFIGSYLPFVIIVGFSILFAWSIKKRKKSFLLVTKIWAIFLFIWSSARLLISLVHLLIKPFEVNHLSNQFGLLSSLFSLCMIAAGIIILRKVKSPQVKAEFDTSINPSTN